MNAIDWKALEENCAGDRGLVTEVLEMFRKDGPELLGAVKSAVDSGDAKLVKRTAHRLKGALVSLAADRAVEVVKLLEAMGHAGDLQTAAEVFASLNAEMQLVFQAVEKPELTP